MIFSPRWLFLIPGTAAFVVGLLGAALLAIRPIVVGGVGFDVSSQIYLSALTVVGYQSVLFAILTKIYAQHEGFRIPRSRNFERLEKRLSLESGALAGLGLFLVGLTIAIIQLAMWGSSGFGSLNAETTIRVAVPACLLMTLGIQTITGSLFLGVLSVGIRSR
jgi:hypothetical protein